MFLKLKNSEYAKNSIILIVGTGLSQLIPIFFQPFLRRIYTDEEFGVFAQFYSIVTILSIVSNLKYDNSIVLPKKDSEALNLVCGSVILNFITSVIFFILFKYFGLFFIQNSGLSLELINYLWLFPISIFFISTNNVFTFWLTRKKKFIGLSVNKGVRRTGEGFSQVILNSVQKSGLIIGLIIGDFINLLMFLFQFKKSDGKFKKFKLKEVINSLKNQIEFPKYSLLPNLLNILSFHLPVFIIAVIYNKGIVGQFDGSRQILALPLSLISTSISQVLYQKLVENSENKAKILPFIKKNFIFLLILSLVGILIFFPFSEMIFTFFFGEKWILAGELSSIMVFSFAIKFIVSPLSIVFIAFKKMKYSAIWQLFYFLMILNLFWFKNLNIYDFIFIYVILDVVSYTIYGFLIYHVIKKRDNNF